MTKRTLESLKSAFGTADNTNREPFNNAWYPFFNMQVGEKAVIRFLPDKDSNNPRGFMVEKASHNLTINGQKKTVACLSQYEEDCPVCKVSQDYYKVKDEVNGKKYWRKKQYITQALIIEDPLPADTTTGENAVGKVRYLTLGFQIYNIIKEAFAGDDLESIPYNFDDGYDFIIKKTKQGQYDSYAIGTKFSNRSRDLTDAELGAAQEGMVELSTLMPKHPGLDKVLGMLNADMNGENYSEAGGSKDEDDEEFETAKSAAPSQRPASKKEADEDTPTPKKDAGKEESSSSVDDMLAAIQARRAAAKKS